VVATAPAGTPERASGSAPATTAAAVRSQAPSKAPARPAASPASEPAPAATPRPASAPAPSAVAKAAARPAPASNAPPAARPARSAALTSALARAESLQQEQRELEALELYRQLGERHPRDPQVLAGWSRVAASTQWWGESLRVAERWAALDRSADAHIHLARTQRRLGQLDKAIGTLKALVERNPKHEEASALLQQFSGTTLALR
jgi:tetratricopeptide (TPR) repeat protein